MNYEVDVVIQAFLQFNPGRSFTLQDLTDFDAQLFTANEAFLLAALQARQIPNPSRFDKSRALQFALAATGDFSAALVFGAGAYRHALDVGAIR